MKISLSILIVFILSLTSLAQAQQNEPLSDKNEDCWISVPAVAFAIPDAFNKGYLGMLNSGATLQSRTRLSGDRFDPDGNLSFGLGLGDPQRWLGVELRTNIYGLADDRGAGNNFGEGTIDVHLSRAINPTLYIGAGSFDLTGWKREEPNQISSAYLTGTKIIVARDSGIFSRIYITVGAGNGHFRTDKTFDVRDEKGWGVFGSMATPIMPRANWMVEWKGHDLASAVSFFPIKKWPIQLVVGMNDILFERRSFIVAGSLSISLFQPPGDICWKYKGRRGPPPAQASRI